MTPQEEEEFRRLAALPNVYEVISKSIAPSIFGGTDMKKAIACLLFGGSRKRWGSGPPQILEGMSNLAPMRVAADGQDLNVLFIFLGPSALPATPRLLPHQPGLLSAGLWLICGLPFPWLSVPWRQAVSPIATMGEARGHGSCERGSQPGVPGCLLL